MQTDRKPPMDDPLVSHLLGGVSEHLASEELERWQAAEASIRSEASRTAEENAALAEDPAAVRWIQLSSILLASYRSLCASL
jgi:hypothetical protein